MCCASRCNALRTGISYIVLLCKMCGSNQRNLNRDILQNDWPVLLIPISVLKDKEKLGTIPD